MLEIKVNSDTGFDDPDDGTEPDPNDFEEVALSTSSISIFAWCCDGDTKLNWFRGVWDQMEWPEVDGEVVESADPPFRIVRKTLNIASLPDREAVRAATSEFKAMSSRALGIALV
jgi:hypothetical protein